MEEKTSILIVDDNLSMCKTMSLVLERKGYVVTTAGDESEAIKRVKKSPFDMVFLDIKMPLMDGVETYLAIKKVNPKAVAIMMTAYPIEVSDLVEQALNNHAYTCLFKPLDMEKLLRLVDEIRQRKLKTG